ncbi:SGNH/GDSL hydrolase family protein [Marinobacter sp.]|uniref:SGNH/GDSL hydrolase family protein n=1 Tax=Marinobacter sp. TaxID=50741 RepID=UPI0035687642
MHIPFWLTTAALFPILLYQGKRARRNTPRLPEAQGNPGGQYGEEKPTLRILILGESTAAGVGVSTHDQGLASQLALQLHERTGQPIAWYTFGVNGIRLGNLNKELANADLPEADVVLLSMGVNDTTGFTGRAKFRQQLHELRALLAPRYPNSIGLLSVPPMHLFTALPAPLRNIMGWRAKQLDRLFRQLADELPEDFRYWSYPTMTDVEMLAKDGYHPSDKGYRAIAEALADKLEKIAG